MPLQPVRHSVTLKGLPREDAGQGHRHRLWTRKDVGSKAGPVTLTTPLSLSFVNKTAMMLPASQVSNLAGTSSNC